MIPSGIITLLTDFGLKDPYVGMMKGALLTINPVARIIDISHGVKAGSIVEAALILRETYPYFPKGTVHVSVVDPGVGSERRGILLVAQSHLFVGPDNGIFWPIINTDQNMKIVHLTETRYFLPHASPTFHGRDIFAPVAAYLSKGADPLEMGPAVNDPSPLVLPAARRKGKTLWGQVIRVDHFGNLMTSIHHREMEIFLGGRTPIIQLGDLIIEGMRKVYADASPQEVLALIGSSGYLEIAVNMGTASDLLGLLDDDIVGLDVQVTPAGEINGHV